MMRKNPTIAARCLSGASRARAASRMRERGEIDPFCMSA
jgi:hypothetical protein